MAAKKKEGNNFLQNNKITFREIALLSRILPLSKFGLPKN
jgi:hypothetical protein